MAQLDTFPNPAPNNDFLISHVNEEFTSVCPITGLPDFANITINYVPDETCVELKSLKYYFLEFRNKGIFYEAITNMILDDLVAVCSPKKMEVISKWTVRGGMHTTVTAKYEKK